MKTETLPLWPDTSINAELVRYIRDDDTACPAVLVIPGGGYTCVCEDTEGRPIAERFATLGFNTFVLHYRVNPNRFPAPVQDAARAMKLIRGRASEWNVIPDAIATCGFSAGGHLAAAVGTLWKLVDASAGDAFDSVSPVPNACILSYAVITGGERGHGGSVENFCGDTSERSRHLFSLEEHVTSDTPPAFIWATNEDNVVPVENSFLYYSALRKNGRVCELHIYPFGNHGMQLGYGRTDIGQWPEQAAAFLHESCGFPGSKR